MSSIDTSNSVAANALPSLLDGIGQGATAPEGSIAAAGPGNSVGSGSVMQKLRGMTAGAHAKLTVQWPARAKNWWGGQMQDPAKRPRALLMLRVGIGVAVIGMGVGSYFALRPVPQPDYMTDGMDDIFNYTLLTDEFNNLPIEERMKLIGQLVKRLKSMSGGDSMLMASFAAGIAGSARKQIEENVSLLAVDMWDKYAKDYTKVPDSERTEYLEATFVEFTKTFEALLGDVNEKSDEQRLADVRKQSDRDRKRMADPNRQPRGEELSNTFRFLDSNVGGNASPEQRSRGAVMLRDMARHFRGQDVSTGKPKGGG
jgi:hypothetical protein